jgi:radical SAM protein with 4Fe4S-binding SPASM domain
MKYKQFLKVKDGSIVSLNPDGATMYVPCNGGEGIRKWSNYISRKLNKDAFNIIQLFNGENTVNDISKIYYKKYKKTLREEVLMNFIRTSQETGLIEILELPSKSDLIIRGSEKYYNPNHMIIEITNSCNFRCKHCYMKAGPENRDYIDTDFLIKQLTEFRDNGGVLIELTGGECMLHKDFFKILDWGTQNFFIVSILTNGSMINEKNIEIFKQYKDKIIFSISLDSYREDFFDSFRGLKGAYDRVTKAMMLLGNNKFFYRASMTVTNDNINDIEKTLILAKTLGATTFSFSPTFDVGRNVSKVDIAKTMEIFAEMKEKYGDFLFSFSKNQIKQFDSKMNCGMGYKTITMSPKGIIRGCVMFSNVGVIGDLKGKSLTEIFSSVKGNDFADIKAPSYETCKGCKFLNYCAGCITRGISKSKEVEKCKWMEMYKEKISKIINVSLH